MGSQIMDRKSSMHRKRYTRHRKRTRHFSTRCIEKGRHVSVSWSRFHCFKLEFIIHVEIHMTLRIKQRVHFDCQILVYASSKKNTYTYKT